MQTSTVSIEDVVAASEKRNLSIPVLYEEAIAAGDGQLAQGGSLVVSTGAHTGRSPRDRFIVESDRTRATVDWNETNQPISRSAYLRLKDATLEHLSRQSCYIQDLAASADPRFRLPVRVVTPSAWHALFEETMFIRGDFDRDGSRLPLFTIVHAPDFHPDPHEFDLRSSTCIVIDFDDSIILIGGTEYAGEIKKSVFSVLNFLLPEHGVLPMHCSCNVGATGDVALFFGLSGTGKTTLSADPDRTLVGDDEHGWSDSGIFNFEGGCYAKVIGLRESHEPEIYATTHMFGTILENVVLNPDTRRIDFQDNRYT